MNELFTRHELACILLRVPETGDLSLDRLIAQSRALDHRSPMEMAVALEQSVRREGAVQQARRKAAIDDELAHLLREQQQARAEVGGAD
ncbi:hypothetical protein MARPU_09450 [Marichromatium purpuratum 984]|uniref:Uncharacterized protein n=1 Tax=Marichromatium purpuratum 984 TaxID=765910 RepID=W0E8E0_MARPU|nr:hypothetical protein [Marichromatium purpuratum]AHF05499.1 hypothetical protein MARPU_09450 [Marichromatium purpuratum 984]